MILRRVSYALAGLMMTGAVAYAAGMFQYPAVTLPLTGDETIPADTNLGQGLNPATEVISVAQLRGAYDGTNSVRTFNTCGEVTTAAADFTNATPSVTEIYFAEIYIPTAGTVTGIAFFNGSDATDSIKGAIADSAGVILGVTADTQQVGTDSYQRIPLTTAITVLPGTYYIESKFDGVVSRYNALAVGNCVAGKQTGATYAAAFADFTPGTTFTADVGPAASLY